MTRDCHGWRGYGWRGYVNKASRSDIASSLYTTNSSFLNKIWMPLYALQTPSNPSECVGRWATSLLGAWSRD